MPAQDGIINLVSSDDDDCNEEDSKDDDDETEINATGTGSDYPAMGTTTGTTKMTDSGNNNETKGAISDDWGVESPSNGIGITSPSNSLIEFALGLTFPSPMERFGTEQDINNLSDKKPPRIDDESSAVLDVGDSTSVVGMDNNGNQHDLSPLQHQCSPQISDDHSLVPHMDDYQVSNDEIEGHTVPVLVCDQDAAVPMVAVSVDQYSNIEDITNTTAAEQTITQTHQDNEAREGKTTEKENFDARSTNNPAMNTNALDPPMACANLKKPSRTNEQQNRERSCFICGKNVKLTPVFSQSTDTWEDIKEVKNVQSYKNMMQHCQHFHPGQIFHFLAKPENARGMKHVFDVKQQSQRLLRNSLQNLRVMIPLQVFVTNKEKHSSQDLLSYLNLIMGGALMSANSKHEETLLAKRQILKDTKAWKIFAGKVMCFLEEILLRLNNFDWVVLGEVVTAYQLWNATNLFFKRGLFDETLFAPVHGLKIPEFNVHDAIKESQNIEE
jgi:hypothetical protein